MSTLKADTIQNTSGGAATFTKQEAIKARGTVNHYSTGAEINTITSSFNFASYTDNAAEDFSITYTNNMSSTPYTLTTGVYSNDDSYIRNIGPNDTSGSYGSTPSTMTTSGTNIHGVYAGANYGTGFNPYNALIITGDLA